MIWIILWLLTALTGVAEEAPVHQEGVVTDECTLRDGTTPPSELPGPR